MNKPGYLRGRHFSSYVPEVKELKRAGELERTESLLLLLVQATENESRATGCGVAPWYYEELAKIYRKQKRYAQEVSILERFTTQKIAPGVKPSELFERLEKAKKQMEDNS